MARDHLERRWIILSQDGRYAPIGNQADPSADAMRTAEDSLRASGFAGWVAVMEGTPYGIPRPRLTLVQSLGEPTGTWEDAVFKFLERH